MKTLSKRCIRLLAILPLAALAANNNPTNELPLLPEPVTAALAAADCEQLIALNQRYHDDDTTTPNRDRAITALEDAILALPGCARVEAALVRVEPLQGTNFFDRERPLGAAPAGF